MMIESATFQVRRHLCLGLLVKFPVSPAVAIGSEIL